MIPESLLDRWDVYHVALHPRNKSGYEKIAYEWSFDEVMLMQDALDAYDKAEAKAAAKPPSS